jgi:transposase
MAVIDGRERYIVGGVDTHKDLHVAAVVDEQDRVIGTRCFATTRQGYRQMLTWMRAFGDLQRIGVESTGSYGAGLLRFMQQAGIAVLEVTTPDKQDRRRRGKSDDLDAQNAAHAAFAGQRTVTPRSRDGMIESLRVLMTCRKTAVSARRVALQVIHNTIVCAPDGLRDQLRSLTRMQLIRIMASWRPDLTAYRDLDCAYRIGLKSLARRYLELHDEIADLDAMIAAIVDELAPNLIARNSIGHIGAAQLLLTAGDNPERLRSEASFASLCGVSPVPASSGKTVRHRLNRGGDPRRQQRIAHHRHRTLTNRPENERLCCSPDSRRAFQTRRHSSVEALPRERSLHAHHSASQGDQRHTNCRLTNRRASVGIVMTGPWASFFSRSSYFRSPSARSSRQR